MKFFFYNSLKEINRTIRSLYIKNQFIDIINNCFWINCERKRSCIHYFSRKERQNGDIILKKFIDKICFYNFSKKNDSNFSRLLPSYNNNEDSP